MSVRALSFAACLSLAACAPAPDTGENVGRADRPIIGGSKATAYPEAVLIDMKEGGRITSACSGAIIAPRVVLTAGHCIYGFDGWNVTAPYAAGQKASSASGVTLDWTNAGETVDPSMHDVGLIFLDQAITLSTYPKIAETPLANGAQVVNVGRIDDGVLSNTNLYVSKPITVSSAAPYGYPYDYIAREVIESGDSGGPDLIPGTHTIVAVNSGGGGGTEVLARVDLLASWIEQQVAAHGGSSATSGPCGHDPCASGSKLASSCDPCVQTICAQDSYCCTNQWDAQCVGEVKTLCGETCGGASDPCQGVTYAGKCSGNTVVWCEANSLQKLSCGASAQCGYDALHGYYNCL